LWVSVTEGKNTIVVSIPKLESQAAARGVHEIKQIFTLLIMEDLNERRCGVPSAKSEPALRRIFLVRSFLYVKLDSLHICTETVFIFQEILRAKSDFGASLQLDCRPMALPYSYGRRLEADHIHFSGRSLHQPTDVGLTMGNELLKVGCNLDKSRFSSANPYNDCVVSAYT
jgi:hypothetical protein